MSKLRVEYDYSKSPPPRIVVILADEDIKRLKEGIVLESSYQFGYGVIIEVRLR